METSGVIDPDEFAKMFEFEPPLDLDAPRTCRAPALFSPHGHVLITIARDPSAALPQIAERVDLSESCVRRIVADLIASRLVAEVRIGGQSRYLVLDGEDPPEGTVAGQARTAVDRLYRVSRG